MVLALMTIGLFMNARISSAFGSAPLLFAGSLVATQLSRGIATRVSAPTPQLREHYQRMLVWLIASAPLWIIGALADPQPRLWWWTVAVTIDVTGTVFAHPWPHRRMHTIDFPSTVRT